MGQSTCHGPGEKSEPTNRVHVIHGGFGVALLLPVELVQDQRHPNKQTEPEIPLSCSRERVLSVALSTDDPNARNWGNHKSSTGSLPEAAVELSCRVRGTFVRAEAARRAATRSILTPLDQKKRNCPSASTPEEIFGDSAPFVSTTAKEGKDSLRTSGTVMSAPVGLSKDMNEYDKYLRDFKVKSVTSELTCMPLPYLWVDRSLFGWCDNKACRWLLNVASCKTFADTG